MRALLLLAFLASPPSLTACGDKEKACSPGATMACTCSTGGEGTQTCTPRGLRFGPCICGGLVSPTLSAPAPPPPTTPYRHPRLDRAEAAAQAYTTLIDAFNRGDRDAYVAGFHPKYCHYSGRRTGDDMANERPGQFVEPTVRRDVTVRPLRIDEDVVVFLQTERFTRPDAIPRRYFKLVEMRLDDGGSTWRLSAEATRSRHGCAPGLLDNVTDSAIDQLKDTLLRSPAVVAQGGLPASVLPTTCYPGPWDGAKTFRIACKHGRGFANIKRGWRPVGAVQTGNTRASLSRKYGWTGVVEERCDTGEGDAAPECRFKRARVYPPRTTDCSSWEPCRRFGLCLDAPSGCICGPEGCHPVPPTATDPSR